MTPDDTAAGPIDVATIRRAVAYLHDHGTPAFASSNYLMPIDPYWLATPERRKALWETLERIVKLDATYGEQPFQSTFGKRGLD